jgi:hypothetical protein
MFQLSFTDSEAARLDLATPLKLKQVLQHYYIYRLLSCPFFTVWLTRACSHSCV